MCLQAHATSSVPSECIFQCRHAVLQAHPLYEQSLYRTYPPRTTVARDRLAIVRVFMPFLDLLSPHFSLLLLYFPLAQPAQGGKQNHTTVALVTNLLHLLCLRHRCGGRYWCKCAQVCACVCVCVCACVHVCTSSSSSSSIFLRLDLAGDAVASCNPPPTHPHACI